MQKHYYYLVAALVFFVMAALSALLVRKSDVGSVQKFIMEKIVSNAFLLAAVALLFCGACACCDEVSDHRRQ
jgi:hypothetical protein